MLPSMTPCCPRPDRHSTAVCPLIERLKDPKMCFDEFSVEEQFFLFEAPYLPRFTGTFPAMTEWCDPARNSSAFTFARLDRDPRLTCSAPQWRQEGSLYVAASGFATGYFSDRTKPGPDRRWRLLEFLAPGSFTEPALPLDTDDGVSLGEPDPFSPAPTPAAAAAAASDSAQVKGKRSRNYEIKCRKKKRTGFRPKGKSAYSCLIQLRSDHHTFLPLFAPAEEFVIPPSCPALPAAICD